jgi:hypothetical protein
MGSSRMPNAAVRKSSFANAFFLNSEKVNEVLKLPLEGTARPQFYLSMW